MDIVIFVIVLLAIFGGVVYWVVNDVRAKAIKEFRPRLKKTLKRDGLENFELYSFADECGVSHSIAEEVGAELYSRLFSKAVADGVITPNEQGALDRLARAVCPNRKVRSRVEKRLKISHYESRAKEALADGVINDDEAKELQELQQRLGIATQEVSTVVGRDAEHSYQVQFRSMLHSGTISHSKLKELDNLRETFGLSKDRAFALVRRDAENSFREYFFDVKQDGEIDDSELKGMKLIQELLQLPTSFCQQYFDEAFELQRLARIRGGDLPSISTTKMLEGGEICHYESECVHQWATPTKIKEARGELTISNHRIIFTSFDGTKNFDFRPAKITDLEPYSNGVKISTSGSRGNGVYLVRKPDLLEAVLFAIASKQKYLTADSFSSEMTRHIPGPVKQEVWARDGGKCVQCGDNQYLEFDHIIPHSKGGANTAKNVQLLCRGCNLAKSDRI